MNAEYRAMMSGTASCEHLCALAPRVPVVEVA